MVETTSIFPFVNFCVLFVYFLVFQPISPAPGSITLKKGDVPEVDISRLCCPKSKHSAQYKFTGSCTEYIYVRRVELTFNYKFYCLNFHVNFVTCLSFVQLEERMRRQSNVTLSELSIAHVMNCIHAIRCVEKLNKTKKLHTQSSIEIICPANELRHFAPN